jgi:hypothetical protein
MNLLPAVLLIVVAGASHAAHGQSLVPRDAAADEPRALVFDCSWFPHPPRAERVLVDLVLARDANDPRTRAAPAELAAIRSAGGMVRHVFHLPVIRAEVDAGAVRAMIAGPGAVATFARTVLDPRLHEVEAQIRYDRPVREADVRFWRDSGHGRWGTFPAPTFSR